jgi:hypothetical protein
MIKNSSIILILSFLILNLTGCMSTTNKKVRKYKSQCYKYYDSRVESKPDKEFCDTCLCIDTAKIRLW